MLSEQHLEFKPGSLSGTGLTCNMAAESVAILSQYGKNSFSLSCPIVRCAPGQHRPYVFGAIPDRASGVPGDDNAGRNGACHYGASGSHGTVSEGDARRNKAVGRSPGIVFEYDRSRDQIKPRAPNVMGGCTEMRPLAHNGARAKVNFVHRVKVSATADSRAVT
ncbi:MAG: hypothetical protein AAF865_10160 [Pseudomonadota bacterium]